MLRFSDFNKEPVMSIVNYKDKTYSVDSHDFLIDFFIWDEDFAEWTAMQLGMPPKLTEEHWDVIYYVRLEFQEKGKCPTVYETCRMCKLGLSDLLRLFPSGYLRGACRIAGVTYKQGYLGQNFMPTTEKDYDVIATEKVYQVDVRGFLVNPDDWDEF
ncbi:MAG TPA: hypothetical protein ENO22_06340 [candidate division Zixibacteria bacterium]|nr:hypothetical protein [candidate division Zixibacteria bacterium]HEQ98943.1 hypothetical protein [candidate division Zixibacteria bacterium]